MPTVYNKVTAGNQTLIDLSQDTVTQASHIMAGYVGHLADGTQVEGTGSGSGTYQAKTNIDPTTSSQTIYPDNGYDALSSVQINAMPSGTAGTPTATKGTVSNHSVSVTPSVTNTTGYITGSTKTGTAVTVSASELVSGSETKTANGTYDVTNLAQLIVNVSGSSGLEYETGTYTPTSNIGRASVSYSKTHSARPMFVLMFDSGSSVNTTNNSISKWWIVNIYACTTSLGSPYAVAEFAYYNSSTGKETTSSNNIQYTSGSGNNRLGGYLTTSGFTSYNTNSYIYQSGRTYKWVAVWPPSSY